MKLSVENLLKISRGLAALDGYDKIIKDGGNEKTAKALYELGAGLRLQIAINLNRLEPFLKAAEKTEQEVNRKYVDGDRVPAEKAPAWREEREAIFSEEVEVDLKKITYSELVTDKNPIPPTVISLLIPILEGVD